MSVPQNIIYQSYCIWEIQTCILQQVQLSVELHVCVHQILRFIILINHTREKTELYFYSLYRKYYKAIIIGRGNQRVYSQNCRDKVLEKCPKQLIT